MKPANKLTKTKVRRAIIDVKSVVQGDTSEYSKGYRAALITLKVILKL